ncbi:MAG: acyltransferase [Bacteroidales bacterium]|nr:acyltransferase [Bacteroidales bacterium]MBN2820699.1 acyltransferase [Bacteroidales bacterium]
MNIQYFKELKESIFHSKKNLHVETLRGLALILMVMGHVFGNSPYEGMRLADDSFGRYIFFTFQYVRMPLFTAISGYVFSLRPVQSNYSNFFKIIKAKSRRLLFPLVFVGTIQFLFQCYAPGVNNEKSLSDIWRIYFFSYSHFWYLQALFAVFIIVGLFDMFNLMNTFWKWLILFITALILHYAIQFPIFFSFNKAIYLLPFFLLGCGIKRYHHTIVENNLVYFIALMLFIIGIVYQQYAWFNTIEIINGPQSLFAMLTGIFGLVVLFRIKFTSKILVFIGYYSYGVFLLHKFGTASSRIFLDTLHISDNKPFVFMTGLSLGIAIPIIMELFINRSKKMRLVILGSK